MVVIIRTVRNGLHALLERIEKGTNKGTSLVLDLKAAQQERGAKHKFLKQCRLSYSV